MTTIEEICQAIKSDEDLKSAFLLLFDCADTVASGGADESPELSKSLELFKPATDYDDPVWYWAYDDRVIGLIERDDKDLSQARRSIVRPAGLTNIQWKKHASDTCIMLNSPELSNPRLP